MAKYSVKPGKLRHRIVIEDPIITLTDEHEEEITGWNTYAKCWASIEPTRAVEWFDGNRVVANVVHQITIRYIKGLDHTMRVKFGDRYFNITGITDIEERHHSQQIFATEAL